MGSFMESPGCFFGVSPMLKQYICKYLYIHPHKQFPNSFTSIFQGEELLKKTYTFCINTTNISFFLRISSGRQILHSVQ